MPIVNYRRRLFTIARRGRHAPSTARSTSTHPASTSAVWRCRGRRTRGRLVAPARPDRDDQRRRRPDRARARRRARRRARGPGRGAAPRARDRAGGRERPADRSIPCASMEASHANTRLWPSGANFNRSFPGRPRRAARRAALRLHHAQPDRRGRHRGRHAQRRALEPVRRVVGDALGRRRRSSGARWSTRCSRGTRRCTSSTSTSPAPACSSGEAERQGKIVVATELGGGGHVLATTHRIAFDGLRNVLRHLGVLAGEVADARVARARPGRDRARDRRRQLPLRARRRPLGDARRPGRPRRAGPARRPHPLHRPARPRADAAARAARRRRLRRARDRAVPSPATTCS